MATSCTTEAGTGGDGNKRSIHFDQNTKIMYETILNKVPWFVRDTSQKKLDAAIYEICVGDTNNDKCVVKEDDMYEVVKRTTPKLFVQKSIDIIDKHKTV